MSKLSRYLWPILAAVILAAVVIGFLLWQLSSATGVLRAQIERGGNSALTAQLTNSSEEMTDVSGDAALTALRKGDLLALQAEWQEAEDAYGEAVDLGAGLIAERKLARAQIQLRKFDEAVSTINRLEQQGIRSEDALLLRALVLLHSQKPDETAKLLTAAEDSPQKHFGQALLAITQQKHEDAKKELDLVIQGWDPALREQAQTLKDAYVEFDRFPVSSAEHLVTLLGRSLAAVQECELALPLLATVLTRAADYRDAWTVQGFCQLATGRPELALVSLEYAYGIDPEKPEVQYFLGRTHSELGDHENAVMFLQYALKNDLSPASPARHLLVKEYEAMGNVPEMVGQLKVLAEAEGATISDVALYVTTALRVNMGAEAADVARNAVNKWPMDATARELLGRVMLAIGSSADAKSAFEEAFKLDPTREDLKKEADKL